MGACYYVELKVCVTNEADAIKALNKYISETKCADFSLDKYAAQGITTETFDDLMRIFFAGWKDNQLTIEKREIYTYYSNDFNASYGWESVMMDMFEVLTPYVLNGSELLIYPDNDYDRLIVRNGICVQLH